MTSLHLLLEQKRAIEEKSLTMKWVYDTQNSTKLLTVLVRAIQHGKSD